MFGKGLVIMICISCMHLVQLDNFCVSECEMPVQVFLFVVPAGVVHTLSILNIYTFMK